jgi:hypothetical protein
MYGPCPPSMTPYRSFESRRNCGVRIWETGIVEWVLMRKISAVILLYQQKRDGLVVSPARCGSSTVELNSVLDLRFLLTVLSLHVSTLLTAPSPVSEMKDHSLRNCRQIDRRMPVEALVSVVESNLLFAVSALGFELIFLFRCGEAGSASCPLCQNSNSALGARVAKPPSTRRIDSPSPTSPHSRRQHFDQRDRTLCVL